LTNGDIYSTESVAKVALACLLNKVNKKHNSNTLFFEFIYGSLGGYNSETSQNQGFDCRWADTFC
jgi:hypothetical protein